MDLNIWCIFASILIVSTGAARYDLGPQRFYETSSPAPRREQNPVTKDVVLYLTPSQIKALEAGGAVVRPADDNEEASEDAQENADQPENAEQEPEQEQEQEQEENEDEVEQPEQQEEPAQPEQNQDSDVEIGAQDFDLEEIFRILNEDQLEQEEENVEQARNEPQVTEEPQEDNAEEERPIPLRFLIRQNQQQNQQSPQQQQRQEQYLAPAEQKARSKTYSAIRYQRNEQLQRSKVQLARQQDARTAQEQQDQVETEAPRRFRLVPYEVVEQPEEAAPEQQSQDEQENQQEPEQQDAQQQTEEQQAELENEESLTALLTPLLSPEKLSEFIGRRKNKLSKNELELQAILSELKQSTKYNDQKYAIEIERLRSNLQKQNALAKAEAIAKVAPQLITKEIQKRKPSQSAKLVKAPASAARKQEGQRKKATRPQPVPVEVKSVPIPVVKTKKVEVARPVPVPVPVTRNVYVKVNKPFLVERVVPVETKKEIPVEIPNRKSQRLTLLRHVWEH